MDSHKIIDAGFMLAAMQMMSTAILGCGRQAGEEEIAKSVHHIMHRMSILRASVFNAFSQEDTDRKIEPGLFNFVTEAALKQACYESGQEKNTEYFLVTPTTIQGIIENIPSIECGQIIAENLSVEERIKKELPFRFFALVTDVYRDFQIENYAKQAYPGISEHIGNIILEAEEWCRSRHGIDNGLLWGMSEAYVKLYRNCLLEEFQHTKIDLRPSQPENVILEENYYEGDLPVDLVNDEEPEIPSDFDGPFEPASSESEGEDMGSILERVWNNYSDMKKQLLRHIAVLEESLGA